MPKKHLRYRPNGSALAVVSLTLWQEPDAKLIQALEAAPNLARLTADALRAYMVDTTVEPRARFRRRKDGRLILPVNLEFYPERDQALIEAILASPPEMISTAIVDLMREGGAGQTRPATAASRETDIDIEGLAVDL